MKSITISVGFKKRKKTEKSLHLMRILFKKIWLEILEIGEDKLVKFEYNSDNSNNFFTLSKGNQNDINVYIRSKKVNRIIETKKLALKNKDIEDNGFVFSLPASFFPIINEIYGEISKSFKVDYEIKNKKGVFYLKEKKEIKNTSSSTEIIKRSLKEKKNVILFKVNKGGVGKTFLTSQIATGLAILGKKVLILTSDSQNNILDFLSKKDESVENGLIKEVLYNKGELINLRKNLYFYPLESSKFGDTFLKKLENWIEEKKKEYDYILIDSIPTLKIDESFINQADHIVIPAYCDGVTINGVLNLLDTIDLDKVMAIQINKYKGRKIEKKYRELLINSIQNTTILLPEEIPDISFIEQMLEMKKSIWEYKNKKADEIQNILMKLIYKIIETVEGGI